MLKHATICRIKRAQQVLGEPWDIAPDANELQTDPSDVDCVATLDKPYSANLLENDANNNNNNSNSQSKFVSLFSGSWVSSNENTIRAASCSSSPTPSSRTITVNRIDSLSSAPASVFSSPSKRRMSTQTATKYCSDSMIKIYAQTLSQDVEYVTLPVNAQTKSQQIIRTLLKKFRLKHRDPNLFYLTLERWIRKDGIRFKSVMLLGDEACPLQLQQCCSNPPHNDIKFTLQMRAGALVKIFCQEICSDTKYKCLSLSAQTTVDETIELMLHCLNILHPPDSKKNQNAVDGAPNLIASHTRHANSPGSTGSASSSSSTSSSSGIESDPTSLQNNFNLAQVSSSMMSPRRIDATSRAGSITSISSSNISNASSVQPSSELYCLVIECENTNYKRILSSEEYLVDVYQNLLDEVRDQPTSTESFKSNDKNLKITSNDLQPDQWFIIKIKRREDLNHHSIKFTSPRQSMPLPPIPSSLSQSVNANTLRDLVTTTQIEVNGQQHRPSSSLAITHNDSSHISKVDMNEFGFISNNRDVNSLRMSCHKRQMSAIVNGNKIENETPPPPAHLIWMPQVKPRRRNLSNASSTFGRPLLNMSAGTTCSRRRYDPAQLADDLNQLNLSNNGTSDIESDSYFNSGSNEHKKTPIDGSFVEPLAEHIREKLSSGASLTSIGLQRDIVTTSPSSIVNN